MADVSTYTGLIPSQHQKPKYLDMVGTVGQCFVDSQNVLRSMPTFFDLDTAVGVGLDYIGLWVGLSRGVRVPLSDVFFSFDVDGLGLDSGAIWYYDGASEYGVSLLDDPSYRLLLRAKIAANKYDGFPDSLVAVLASIFAPIPVTVTDNMDCSISVTVGGAPPSELFRQIVLQNYLPLKPGGISISYTFTS